MLKITLYGIPETVTDWVSNVTSGSVFDLVWKLFVLVFVVVAAALLASLGTVGAVFAFAMLAALIGEYPRQLVRNVWNREWAEVSAPW